MQKKIFSRHGSYEVSQKIISGNLGLVLKLKVENVRIIYNIFLHKFFFHFYQMQHICTSENKYSFKFCGLLISELTLPKYVRVNTIKTDRDTVVQEFTEKSWSHVPCSKER